MKTMQKEIQENLKRMMEGMMNTNQSKTDVKLEEFSEAMEETLVEREEPTSVDRIACQETTVCHEDMEAAIEKTEPDSGTMQSVAEHREAPEEDAVVKSVRGPYRHIHLVRDLTLSVIYNLAHNKKVTQIYAPFCFPCEWVVH
jgi:hypothetical protein